VGRRSAPTDRARMARYRSRNGLVRGRTTWSNILASLRSALTFVVDARPAVPSCSVLNPRQLGGRWFSAGGACCARRASISSPSRLASLTGSRGSKAWRGRIGRCHGAEVGARGFESEPVMGRGEPASLRHLPYRRMPDWTTSSLGNHDTMGATPRDRRDMRMRRRVGGRVVPPRPAEVAGANRFTVTMHAIPTGGGCLCGQQRRSAAQDREKGNGSSGHL
jgi:hypothetical protein